MSDVAAIYANHMTAQEMRQIIAFYRTPVGAKALALMPRVNTELLSAMAPRLKDLHQKITTALADILQKKGYKTR
jgi:hypothetical protein